MRRWTTLVLVDDFQEKIVLDKKEETESSIQVYTSGKILDTHRMDP